ncbi:MAG: hypothetical protein LBE13_03795 [Bacteroidales bacterium]|jgi:hypothetical protein|nr:hypothetical protein [Bacteroidales bacterium]
MDIKSLIAMVKKNPAMVIGKPSISRLAMFLNGYIWAVLDQENIGEWPSKRKEESYDFLLGQYNDWLAVRYPEGKSLGWESILLLVTGNEEAALSLFWDTWEEFLADPHREENAAQWYAWLE